MVVDLVTDRTERLAPGTVLDTDTGRRLSVRSSRRQGPGSRWLVHFEGIGSREDAETVRGAVLQAPPLPSDPDAVFVHELIGAEVVSTAGRRAGTVVAIEANPASDLLVLDTGALVPLHFVVSHEPGVRLVVDAPEGLLPDDMPEDTPTETPTEEDGEPT